MDHLIRREYAVQKRPLTICEVGVGSGGLLKFVTGVTVENEENKLPSWIVSWDGVSRRVDPAALRGIGYTGCVELNLEDSKLELHQAYDVIVLLHVLEHLHKPETVLARLLPFVKAGGIIVGGAPTLPDVFRSLRERQLRKDAQPFGHVSVISPNRLRQAALHLQLSVEFLTGAYLLRATGSCLESSRT